MSFETAEPGDRIDIDFKVTNTGQIPGDQDILLTLENGDKLTLDEVPGLELEVDETGDGQLVWEIPEDIEEQVYDLCVESDNTSDCIFDPFAVFNAADANQLDTLWSEDFDHNSSLNDVVGYEGDMYIASTEGDGGLESRNPSDGSLNWFEGLEDDMFPISLSISDGVAYICDSDEVISFDIDEREVLWRVGDEFTESDDYTPRAVESDKDGVYFNFGSDTATVGAIGLDGSKLWESETFDTNGSPNSTVSLTQTDNIVAASSRETIAAFDKSNGEEIWVVEDAENTLSSSNNQVYSVDGPMNYTIIDASDGSISGSGQEFEDDRVRYIRVRDEILYGMDSEGTLQVFEDVDSELEFRWSDSMLTDDGAIDVVDNKILAVERGGAGVFRMR